MADFSYLSDTDDSAVEEILAEAADHVALKQLAAINLSGVSDSVLPQNLESRFRRLKTFPSNQPEHPSAGGVPPKLAGETGPASAPARAEHPKAKSSSSPCSSSSSSPNSWLEGKNSGKLKPARGFGSGRRSGSAKKGGCLWWSPGKARRKKSSGGGGNDDVLEDLKWFTKKEQERIMRKAGKEEMKVKKEAEKMVQWAKQVSARMEAFGVEDDDLPHKRH